MKMIDFEKICRLCLIQFEDADCQLLFADDKIAQMLNDLLKIQLNPRSRVPFKICLSCNQRLEGFQEFYSCANKNQMKILDLMLTQRLDVALTNTQTLTDTQTIPDELIKVENEVEIEYDTNYEEPNIQLPSHENHDSYRRQHLGSILTDMYKNLSQLDSPTTLSYFELFPNEQCTRSALVKVEENHTLLSYSTVTVKSSSFYTENQVPVPDSNTPLPAHQLELPGYEYSRRKRCNECGVWVLNVKQHKRCVHSNDSNQKCHICNRIFSNQLKLMMHTNYKHKPARFNCKICGKALKNRVSFTIITF